ncbi:MAG: hypothetical protein LJE64_02485 [Desulfofustis sp.]|jgi:hypothetical protein|nr:hypothetical protein [Desulfofustis sp.]
MKSVIIAVCLMLGLASLSGAAENPFVQFNADVEKAYAAYRKALFQTNKNDAAKSAEANDSFIRQWQQIRQTYGSSPPQVFSSDLKWESTLSAVEEIAQNSADQIRQGNLAEAHETLEAIRDELTDLRKRNSVIVFSDHINNYHRVMEALLTGGFTPNTIDEPAVSRIQGQLAVLNYLAGAIRENAPQAYRENQQYQQLEKGLFESLAALKTAVESKDPAAMSKSINMLKPAYAKLFLNFG